MIKYALICAKNLISTAENGQLIYKALMSQVRYSFTLKFNKPNLLKAQQRIEQQRKQKNEANQQKQQVLKTYLQIIPPHRLQKLLHPQKTDISEFTNLPQGSKLQLEQLQKLHKKLKKSVHMIPIQQLTKALQVIGATEQTEAKEQCKALSRKIYTKIVNNTFKKLNSLSLEQIVDFIYKMVKLNYKQFQLMKEAERIIIEQKIKINYPLIRKILWAYTHLDAGSAVLYSHISKTLKIGQHQLSPLELAQSAYMLSKISENATGGYGVFLIAEKHLLAHLPRLSFHDLVKASSYMLTQNIGSNDFQTQLEAQLYKKYPDKPQLRINDLVTLLKSTSGYYFKYKQKALLNMLQTSTRKLAPQTNLEQFQDMVWSWGRAGKGDKELWDVLEEQINKKYINLLKPRQLAFMYYSLCSSQYTSPETITALQNKFIEMVNTNPNINEHYLLKFLLGMQKRKDYSQKSFAKVSQMIADRMSKLSIKQLVTFSKILNDSDICYDNKDNFKDMENSLLKACKLAIADKIYMFRITDLVQILYMWIKLDVASDPSFSFTEVLFSQLDRSVHQIPKSVFIKALFCFTIRDKYKQSFEMVVILQELLKYGPVSYFFSPYELPLAAYCVFHLVVNSNQKIEVKKDLIDQLSQTMDKINPVILNRFVRNGYQECMRLKTKYYQQNPEGETQNKRKKRKN